VPGGFHATFPIVVREHQGIKRTGSRKAQQTMEVFPLNSEHRLKVRIDVHSEEQCRFTLDGTEPTAESKLVEGGGIDITSADARDICLHVRSATGVSVKRNYRLNQGWGCVLALRDSLEEHHLTIDLTEEPTRYSHKYNRRKELMYNSENLSLPPVEVSWVSLRQMRVTVPSNFSAISLDGQRGINGNFWIENKQKMRIHGALYQFFIYGDKCPLLADVISDSLRDLYEEEG
jgi:hypothetical protein